MNLQQQERFYQVMTNSRSRAASLSSGKEVARVTELVNGLLVSKPKPEVIDLQEYAKSAAASVRGINKMKAIHSWKNLKLNRKIKITGYISI